MIAKMAGRKEREIIILAPERKSIRNSTAFVPRSTFKLESIQASRHAKLHPNNSAKIFRCGSMTMPCLVNDGKVCCISGPCLVDG
jgi:hypothetical protein